MQTQNICFSDPTARMFIVRKKQDFNSPICLYFNPTTVCPKGGRSTGYGVKSDQSHHVNKHSAAFQHEQSSLVWLGGLD